MSVKVSVVTAVYNDEKYIASSVQSILQQTLSEIEYIVVDDGSTDSTLEILNGLAQSDSRLKIVTQKNMGAAAARNAAFALARGEYIALQDSDDLSHETRLYSQYERLSRISDRVISCTGYHIIDVEGRHITSNNKIYSDINANILAGSFCACHPSIMFSRSLLNEVAGYNPFYKKAEDYDFIYRLMEKGAYFEKVDTCLYSCRIRRNSEGSMNTGLYARRVFENHLKRKHQMTEDFRDIHGDSKPVRNHYWRRIGNELFFSENYFGFLRFYFTKFYLLPFHKYAPYVLYSLLPVSLKAFVKERIRQIRLY